MQVHVFIAGIDDNQSTMIITQQSQFFINSHPERGLINSKKYCLKSQPIYHKSYILVNSLEFHIVQ